MDTAIQRTGISTTTNFICVCQRGTEIYYIKLSLTSHLFEELNLTIRREI